LARIEHSLNLITVAKKEIHGERIDRDVQRSTVRATGGSDTGANGES